jgi:hypothetical protein
MPERSIHLSQVTSYDMISIFSLYRSKFNMDIHTARILSPTLPPELRYVTMADQYNQSLGL